MRDPEFLRLARKTEAEDRAHAREAYEEFESMQTPEAIEARWLERMAAQPLWWSNVHYEREHG